MNVGDISKRFCRTCLKETNTEVLAQHRDAWQSDDRYVDGVVYYYILKCRGCDFISFLEESFCSEDSDYRTNPATGEAELYSVPTLTHWPPKAGRTKPAWIGNLKGNRTLIDLFDELYKALNQDALVLSSIGVRTIFDSISTQLGIEEDNFAGKLRVLREKGFISTSERESLEVLIDAGSAAAHRGWCPDPTELSHMVNLLGAIPIKV